MTTYTVQFPYATTGAGPSITQYVKVSDGSSAGSAPSLTEIGNGIYKFTATPTYDIAFTADAGAGSDMDVRTARGVIGPADAYLDAAVSTLATASALASLVTTVGGLATSAALSTLSTTVGTLATAANLATLSTTVGGLVTTAATLATSAALATVNTLATAAAGYAQRASRLIEGRRKIDTGTNRETVYDTDGTTPLQRYALKNAAGAATSGPEIYERAPIDPVV